MPVSDTTIVCGVDFGTTYSGFAMGHRKDKDGKVTGQYDWKGQPVKYCKTLTQLFYEKAEDGHWTAKKWGWAALKEVCHSHVGMMHRCSGTVGLIMGWRDCKDS
ncbi:hypothetical protein KIPB_006924 [Kipferlia bialata]|uniref:Uncharacterized protein n=1 Tax=Kipferlia bialata TaxID=797122 RepID=A0A9K3D0C2_9EUKA|nr:hypothetical protein KIPB_006924 [Kipferlia bialata]|eukprot:g6924.t1